jgi:hypothetical protein
MDGSHTLFRYRLIWPLHRKTLPATQREERVREKVARDSWGRGGERGRYGGNKKCVYTSIQI